MSGLANRDKGVVIPYTSKDDIRMIKEVGNNLIEQLVTEEFSKLHVNAEIIRNYRKRLQIFHAGLIKNIKDNITISKSADSEAKKEVTEYSEKDEKLAIENDKMVAELHNIIEKNRNNKQVVIERIKTRIKQDFEKYTQEEAANAGKSNSENFDIICIDGENRTKPITKERFLKSFQDNYMNKLKNSLDSHKVSYENFEDIYQRRKHLFVDIKDKQDELFFMLKDIDFDLTNEEKVLFDRD